MVLKTKRKKVKIGLLTAVILGLACFLTGFYVSFFMFAGGLNIRRLKKLEMEEMVDAADHEKREPMPNGESGSSTIEEIPFQVLSWKPRTFYFPNFVSEEQCNNIIKLAKSRLGPSGLVLRKGETVESTKDVRTSSGAFIRADDDETRTLEFVEEKIAKAAMIPRSYGEVFNVLRYEIGQKYDAHYDSFNPKEYGPQTSQRIASFLLYLSDVEEGGHTMFPFENDADWGGAFNFRQCIGYKVKPRRGDGILFFNLLPNGTIDHTSLHGSCPVVKGEKWVMTKWIRNELHF